jgi:hypothetical protein
LSSATECQLGLENTAIKVGYSKPHQQLTKQKDCLPQVKQLMVEVAAADAATVHSAHPVASNRTNPKKNQPLQHQNRHPLSTIKSFGITLYSQRHSLVNCKRTFFVSITD